MDGKLHVEEPRARETIRWRPKHSPTFTPSSRRSFTTECSGSLTDSELLARFLTGDAASAEAAFAILVDRHGPMVMRVCRSALGNTHDAEDASQAVFLVLARRARSVRRLDSLASWLYGVARRIAARARRDDARRRKHERRRAELAARHSEAPVVSRRLRRKFTRRSTRCPRSTASAVVLCYLEGLSHEQAAQWLRCPLRTFQSRLLRAKERLRERLARRGASLPAVLPPLANCIVPIRRVGEDHSRGREGLRRWPGHGRDGRYLFRDASPWPGHRSRPRFSYRG